MTSLLKQAEAWIAADPDPETRAELEQLLSADSNAEIQRRFGGTLKFGTAGLRGELGAGPNRMNRVVVRQTTAALMDYLGELAGAANAEAANAKPPKIVIGYDGRNKSDVFARDAAAVAAAKGAQAILLEGVVPTPVLARAVLRHGCDAGIMITASHNPPQDNGYKVYWNDGAQIIPPHDRKIERTCHQIGLLPRDFGSDANFFSAAPKDSGFSTQTLQSDVESDVGTGASFCQIVSAADEIDEYVRVAAAQISSLFENSTNERSGEMGTDASGPAAETSHLQVVYTPLHGVGKAALLRLFEELRLPEPILVPEQAEPDGDFPTVQFPNPEEPGALDLVLQLAAEEDADVVLANDPDADRLCVAIKTSSAGTHSSPPYRILSGDELGCLLAEGMLSLLRKGSQEGKLLVGTTIVSSQLLAKIANAHGAAFGETLTGFKWLARLGSSKPGQFVFGYEEALGFSVLPDLVRDKDGITAAAVFMLLMQEWQAEGASPLERLAALYREHGLHKSRQISFRYEGDNAQVATAAIMGSLRMSPPEKLAIRSAVDYAEGMAGTVPANVLVYFLQSGARVIIRPSGTEPKLKAYLEVIEPVGDSDDPNAAIAEATDLATAQLDALETAARDLISERSEG